HILENSQEYQEIAVIASRGEEVIVRGTFYEKDNSIVFAELEHYNDIRGLFSENPYLIIFDEATPTLLDRKNKYLENEPNEEIDEIADKEL
ncbi:4387_t:CDS:2, partial [Funneliformis geosporum]